VRPILKVRKWPSGKGLSPAVLVDRKQAAEQKKLAVAEARRAQAMY